MEEPEEDPPDKVLAERLIALDENLVEALLDVPTQAVARELRVEYYRKVIRAWMDGD